MPSSAKNLWATGTWWTQLQANNSALCAKSWILKLGLLLTLLRKLSKIAPLRAHKFFTTDWFLSSSIVDILVFLIYEYRN
ncbi:hypothetical protein ATN96_00090 [Companilactobacillus paralimentarius]|nr:hypothetical protein ATN96_00105 [Companilactobacillus paralimentarius]KAE9565668.1 hypothetical protein ATN96_00090 [Companilactobacillus paralimentarius]